MRLDDLDYDLPPERIAQAPADRREDARLLVVPRTGGARTHRRIADLPQLVGPGDLLVVNDTKVLAARVATRRAGTGGRVEVLFLEPVPGEGWRVLLRSGGRPQVGEALTVGTDRIHLRAREAGATWCVEVEAEGGAEGLMARHGRMPLPPHIERASDDARGAEDRDRYQTTYARAPGAVAAPTAGLHLTPTLLDACRVRGADVACVTLHVGLGTFEPVRTADLDDHPMHEERYDVPAETVAAVARTRAAGGRVLAVGTTTVRTLEAASSEVGELVAGSGRTRLLIQPGHRFRQVDGLLTNFHLPRSTLLALVAAFASLDTVRAAYADAIEAAYRFYSYGDAMWLV